MFELLKYESWLWSLKKLKETHRKQKIEQNEKYCMHSNICQQKFKKKNKN